MKQYVPYQNREVNSNILRLKEILKGSADRIFLERSLLYMESFSKTDGEPMVLRRAKALSHVLNNLTIHIDPDEIIVGGRSPYPRMGVPSTEGSVEWLLEELDTISKRLQEPFEITDEQKESFKTAIYPFFKGKTLSDCIQMELPEDVSEAAAGGIFNLNQTTHSQGHILPDTEKWLGAGVEGIIEEVEEYGKREVNENRSVFYESLSISCRAAQNFMVRYGERAESVGLLEISQVCRKISAEPPESFREAVQSLWFLFIILHIESIGSSFSPGRLDQVLYPYYRNDVERGVLSDAGAIDIIEALYIKFNEVVLLRSEPSARYFAGFPIGFNVILGGVDKDGNDAVNELSFLFLKALSDLRLPQPNLSVRVHAGAGQDFLEAAAYVISRGSGMPQVFNDEAIIPALLNRGVRMEDARNYAVIGCVEIGIPGKYLGLSDAALFNLARLFELSFEEKVHESFDDLEKTVQKNLRHYVRLMVEGCNIVDRAHGAVLPTPFLSSVIYNCLEKGLDVSAGGAYYNFTGVQGVGIANIADSLYAVKKILFEDEEVTYTELIEILEENFHDHEMLRHRLLNRLPKFGNNCEEVDLLASKWSFLYNSEVEKHKNPRGGSYQPGLYTVSAHVPLGAVVGATPDGRLRGEPLADGGLSPMRGRDRRGPLAVLQSVSRIDQIRSSNGALLNLKFHPSVFEGEESLSKFADFLRGFSALKNIHVQFNVVSAETLKKAKKSPDDYRDLVVRVAGYSAFFVELSEALQDDIIERTEHIA